MSVLVCTVVSFRQQSSQQRDIRPAFLCLQLEAIYDRHEYLTFSKLDLVFALANGSCLAIDIYDVQIISYERSQAFGDGPIGARSQLVQDQTQVLSEVLFLFPLGQTLLCTFS